MDQPIVDRTEANADSLLFVFPRTRRLAPNPISLDPKRPTLTAAEIDVLSTKVDKSGTLDGGSREYPRASAIDWLYGASI